MHFGASLLFPTEGSQLKKIKGGTVYFKELGCLEEAWVPEHGTQVKWLVVATRQREAETRVQLQV